MKRQPYFSSCFRVFLAGRAALVVSAMACLCLFSYTVAINTAQAETSSTSTKVAAKTTNLTESERQALLAFISAKAMLPLYDEVQSTADTLLKDVKAFCTTKNADNLHTARASWKQAALAWQQVDGLLFGPSVDENIDFSVYFLPIKKSNIKALFDQDNITSKDVDAAGIGAQGFGALEYVLFSRTENTTEILNGFIDTPHRCDYLNSATTLLHENLSTISRQWHHYGEQFGLAGKNSLFFLESSEAMELLVNKLFQSAQKTALKKTAFLSNKKKIKRSAAYKLHAWRSGTSLAQIKASVRGYQRILNDGGILAWLKAHQHTELAEQLNTVMQDINAQAITHDDLFKQVQTAPEDLQALVSSSHVLSELIKNQLAPSLGVELGFNDNDGD